MNHKTSNMKNSFNKKFHISNFQLRNQSGFTLMEIVVATTIFTIVFMSLLALFNYTLKINRKAEALRQATQGMRNFVEYVVKEVRNGQIDYYVINGIIPVPAFSATSPCRLPAGGVGSDTYFNKENRLGIINTDGVQECIYFGKKDGTYIDTIGSTPSTFATSTGGTLVLEKAGIATPQILNPPNFNIESLMFIVRPLKDPYTYSGGLPKIAPSVSIFIKFITTLPTGEQVPIYYQTTVSTTQYDIPSQ